MYKKILVANRGEIALRIIRACRELGIKTVAVYSTADALSLHVRFADEAICIGPPSSDKSYLHIPAIIAAAELTGPDGIHPGYGFLAENAEFASICAENRIDFIGPPAQTISQMGDKATAKITMKKVGVPVVPGSDGIVENRTEAAKIAAEIGYPVLIKASAGGGGKGMRLVKSEKEIENAFVAAQSEAQKFFNNHEVYIEKFVEEPRHIEIQILGDKSGNIFPLGERECSVQRRHQKLLEESPSVAVSPTIRKKMYKAAVKGAKAVKYVGAGTIEFLLDKHGDFYFMEMNTRIQVEHPVTEMVIGADLLKAQILCHAGEKLPNWMKNAELRGHSIECRINAENPDKDFMPSPGKISSFHMPGGAGVRVDSAAYANYTIPPYYDSMIAKIIVHGKNRDEAISRMLGALDETVIEGVHTTVDFHKKILSNPAFQSGKYDTGFLENYVLNEAKHEHS